MKARRQSCILDVVRSERVETQEELGAHLHRQGFPVTQATVSRDIKELGLVKVPTGDGRYRYAPPPEDGWLPSLSDRMMRIFRECVTGFDSSENLVVIHTLPATAQGVAEAVDGLRAAEVIGTLAGERTVFVVVKPKQAVPRFIERLRTILEPGLRRRRP